MQAVPRPAIASRSTAWRTSRRPTPRGRRSEGSAESASTAPPTGSVAAPVKPTSPLYGRMIPGVASPCSASRAAITVNAVPSRTVRPSFRRAPTIVSATAARVAATAVRPTPAKCVHAPNETWSCARKPSRLVGSRIAAAAQASAGTAVCPGSRTPQVSARAEPCLIPWLGEGLERALVRAGAADARRAGGGVAEARAALRLERAVRDHVQRLPQPRVAEGLRGGHVRAGADQAEPGRERRQRVGLDAEPAQAVGGLRAVEARARPQLLQRIVRADQRRSGQAAGELERVQPAAGGEQPACRGGQLRRRPLEQRAVPADAHVARRAGRRRASAAT